MKNIRFIALAVICFVIGGFLALTQPEAHQQQQQQEVAGVPIGGAFSLTDHSGKAVTEKSWPGKYTLVFFGFTHCPDICPAGLQKIAAAMDKLKTDKVVPLFITVDPARDDVKTMAAYVANFNPTIVGLTGTQAQIDTAVSAYKVYATVEKDDHDHGHGGHEGHDGMADMPKVNHSGYMYLMSPEGKLLETFGGDTTVETLIERLKLRTL